MRHADAPLRAATVIESDSQFVLRAAAVAEGDSPVSILPPLLCFWVCLCCPFCR